LRLYKEPKRAGEKGGYTFLISLSNIKDAKQRLVLSTEDTEGSESTEGQSEGGKGSSEVQKKINESPSLSLGSSVKDWRPDLKASMSEVELMRLALQTFKALEGPDRKALEDTIFIQALEATGKFSNEEAAKMLQLLIRSGQICIVEPHFYKRK
ncbi:MAG: hypothetical protein ACRECH_15370, partial [Nitrososphaerales archaeon]